ARFEDLLDQDPTKPAAIDVKISGEPPPVGEYELLQESVRALRGRDHRPLQAGDAALQRLLAQVAGDQPRIEMQCVANARRRAPGCRCRKAELALGPERRAKTVVDDPRRPSRGLRLLPVMIEGTSIDRGAESAEGVPVQVPDPPPIPIADAELVGGAGPT